MWVYVCVQCTVYSTHTYPHIIWNMRTRDVRHTHVVVVVTVIAGVVLQVNKRESRDVQNNQYC